MNCEETLAQLSAYLDGQLGEAHLRAVESHLATCSHCRAEAAALRRTIELVSALPPVAPPPGFSQRVMAQVREEANRAAPRRSFMPFWFRIPLQAAAVLVIAGLAVYLYELNRPAPPPQAPAKAPAPSVEGGVRMDRDRQTALPEASAPAKTLPSQEVERPAPAGNAQSADALKPASSGLNAPAAQAFKSEAAGSVAGKLEEKKAAGGGSMVDQTTVDEVAASMRPADRSLTLTPDSSHRDQTLLANTIIELARKAGGTPVPAAPPPAAAEAERRSSDQATAPTVIWLTMPADRYDSFTRELARLGAVNPEKPVAQMAPRAGIEPLMKMKAAPSEPESAPAVFRVKLTLILPQ